MVKLTIQIDLEDLVNVNQANDVVRSQLPTVPADYDTQQSLNNQKVWYKTYEKGMRWVTMEGRGESPLNCTDIIIRMSPGNPDVLEDEEMCEHPKYGEVLYEDYPENMYIQSERLRQLEDMMGYVEGADNFAPMVD